MQIIWQKIGQIVELPVLPTVPYGISYVHKSFPGTIYISEDIYKGYISDILESLKSNNVEKVFILNAHGGNYQSLKDACESVEDETFNCNILNWFECINDEIFLPEHRSHAGSMETSVLMAIDKKYIREDKVENMIPNESYRHTIISDMLECTYNGVILRADGFSYDKGVQCIDYAIKYISNEIEGNLCKKK